MNEVTLTHEEALRTQQVLDRDADQRSTQRRTLDGNVLAEPLVLEVHSLLHQFAQEDGKYLSCRSGDTLHGKLSDVVFGR